MKSKYIQYIALVLLLATGATSCNKFLEEPVDNRTLIQTLPDMEKVLNSNLPYSDHHFTDLMTDDYVFRDLSGHIVASATDALLPIFEFACNRENISSNQYLSSGFNPVTAFRRYYYCMVNSLLVIDRAKAYPSRNAQDEARVKVILGRAKAIRAYCNYMLVSLFAKQYNASTAATDVAVPFIEKYNGEAIVPYATTTVAKLYDVIEDDLLQAYSLLQEEDVDGDPFSFGVDAVLALLSRVYLNKKDWDNCIKYSNMLIDRRPSVLNVRKLRTENTDYAAYSGLYFDPANKSDILMGSNTYQLIAYFFHGFYPYPALQLMQANSADPTNNYIIQTSPLFRDYVPQKFGKFFNSSTRNFNLPLLTADEVYFNRAEASIEKNNGMNSVAIADLSLLIDNQTFTTAEGNNKKSQLAGLTTRKPAIDMLLLIKRIRFSSEGMRWFDIRRHNIAVSHLGRSGTYTVSKAEDYVIKLPLEEITRNMGLN
ncbi:SusD family protein [Filimonas lacunae]|uniref:SusD family protein n=1 Tax=Filimonas lacunae TaxID=477680 RepID=A0A173MDL9_9BACT|nr:RagB/SusD family nutrient uptake outer membrane protein [Filimonas lacunae]BAV05541.1 hypothetical protein FLA_1548 [Filimonas lacunae]SIT20480.1 SusD family protein [Filimonas lacunae]